MNFANKKILITGGASGIGKALIAELYNYGARSFAVMGRDLQKMQALGAQFPEATFLFLQADLGKPQAIKKAMVEIQEKWQALDILINNAGVVSAGPLEDISDEDIIAMQNINTTGLILMTKYALPLLKQSREAAILNVSSGLGLIGMAFYAPYAATKAAVRQFSEAMRRELQGQHIQVMTLYPTATDTPMMSKTNAANMDTPELVAQKAIEGLMNKEIEVMMGGEAMQQNRRLNFEVPEQLDEKLSASFEAMSKRAAGHRAM